MGVGSGLYMYDVVVKRSRSLSHLLMSSCPLLFLPSTRNTVTLSAFRSNFKILLLAALRPTYRS